MGLGPLRLARRIAPAVPQQEGIEPLPRRLLHRLHVPPRPHQVSDRLLPLVRHPYRRQLPRPVQACQTQRIPPVRLYPLPRLARNQRRRHHLAHRAQPGQPPVHLVAARPRLVAEPDHLPVRTQAPHQLVQRLRRIGDLPKVPRLSATRLRDPHRNRRLMNVQPYVLAKLHHDLPPSMWLYVSGFRLQHNPRRLKAGRSIHDVYAGFLGHDVQVTDGAAGVGNQGRDEGVVFLDLLVDGEEGRRLAVGEDRMNAWGLVLERATPSERRVAGNDRLEPLQHPMLEALGGRFGILRIEVGDEPGDGLRFGDVQALPMALQSPSSPSRPCDGAQSFSPRATFCP